MHIVRYTSGGYYVYECGAVTEELPTKDGTVVVSTMSHHRVRQTMTKKGVSCLFCLESEV